MSAKGQGVTKLSVLIDSIVQGTGHVTIPKTKGTTAIPVNVIFDLATIQGTWRDEQPDDLKFDAFLENKRNGI